MDNVSNNTTTNTTTAEGCCHNLNVSNNNTGSKVESLSSNGCSIKANTHLRANNNNNYNNINNNQKQIPIQQQQQKQQGRHLDRNINVRPIGLRRQPTKYPHGLGISVQMISSSNTENVAPEMQVERLKYPLADKYMKRFCRWRYWRWSIILLAGFLLCFGLIAYCMWLHEVSIRREQFLLQQRYQFDETLSELNEESSAIFSITESADNLLNTLIHSTTETPNQRKHYPSKDITLLRAISANQQQQQHHRMKEQKLTTNEYDTSKGYVKWENLKKHTEKAETPSIESTTLLTEEAILIPKHFVGMTTRHHNNFDVSDEHEERNLKQSNRLEPINTKGSYTVNNLAKVSPTIPPVTYTKPTLAATTPMRSNSAQENGCYSTSLAMCQGVIDYDLTYNSTSGLNAMEQEAYRTLIDSNCSARAIEFICITLEPECRPSHIGVLPPCRRICKAIQEACSITIANSDIITALFDCNLYPDSNDPYKCEDPTRRQQFCYDNEFKCYDESCLPKSWHCDNIKDCAAGEDEEGCLVCDNEDEFRCHSNEKCLPESQRCDSNYDCFDGSDEENCEDFDTTVDEPSALEEGSSALNTFAHDFAYASFLSPNQSNSNLYTYITAVSDEKSGYKFNIREILNDTGGISNETVTNNIPGEGLVNFRDSKEIMMTSDTENKLKYSGAAAAAASRANRTFNKIQSASQTTPPLPLASAASLRIAVTTGVPVKAASCALHELRCVSGKCITVEQLCDKKMDCPDGADELKCVYKDRSTTIRNNLISSSTTARPSEKRMLRTTIKRKIKNN